MLKCHMDVKHCAYMLVVHPGYTTDTVEKPCICDTRGIICIYQCDHTLHKRLAHGNTNVHKCNMCGKSYEYAAVLRSHIVEHTHDNAGETVEGSQTKKKIAKGMYCSEIPVMDNAE